MKRGRPGEQSMAARKTAGANPVTPEIRAFEYAAGLFAVLIGLAVADIATSFHRLLRVKSAVRWDSLALLAAGYTLCQVVAMWFDLWGVRHFGTIRYFFFYLSLIAEFFVLFLLSATSLPDERGEGVDLREYYSGNRRYFWTLVTLFQTVYVADGFYFARGEIGKYPLQVIVMANVIMCAPLAISVVLLCVKKRSAHYIGILLLLIIMGLHYGAASIN